ncbi:hypothetical protein ACJJTC_002709 [Scirpophaga incertulas]
MFAKLVKLLYFWLIIQVETSLSQNDGWIPLTKEDAYDKLLREPAARFLTDYKAFSHEIPPDVKELKEDAIKMTIPLNNFQIIQNDAVKLEQVSNNQKYRNICENEDCSDIEIEKHNSIDKYENLTTASLENKTEITKRQPKHIRREKNVRHDEPKLIDRVFQNIGDENRETVKYDINYSNGKNNLYKVIEDNPEFDVTDDAALSGISPEIDSTNQGGYIDEIRPPDAKHLTDSYITNHFLRILSKYNIKQGDNLPNYVLSRQRKVGNQNLMLIPFPLKIPPRYNSLNHLTADPSLAVFLSNYGYYLPGLYGIQSKYRNLYGYLASNNIHNNRPFGSYKIFSDTDSSN